MWECGIFPIYTVQFPKIRREISFAVGAAAIPPSAVSRNEVGSARPTRYMTVRDLEKLAKSAAGRKSAPKAPPSARRATFFDEVEIALAQQLGRRVRVSTADGKKGKLEIEFYSQDELQDLALRLEKE